MKVRDLYQHLNRHQVHYDPRNDRLRLQLNGFRLTVRNHRRSSFRVSYHHADRSCYGHDLLSSDNVIKLFDHLLNISKLYQLIKEDFPWLSSMICGDYFVNLGLLFEPTVIWHIWYLQNKNQFITVCGKNYITFKLERTRPALLELIAEMAIKYSTLWHELLSREYLGIGDGDILSDLVGRIIDQETAKISRS